MNHYHVTYLTSVGTLKNVRQSTKVYAQSAKIAESKVLASHSAISQVIQSYDLGN